MDLIKIITLYYEQLHSKGSSPFGLDFSTTEPAFVTLLSQVCGHPKYASSEERSDEITLQVSLSLYLILKNF